MQICPVYLTVHAWCLVCYNHMDTKLHNVTWRSDCRLYMSIYFATKRMYDLCYIVCNILLTCTLNNRLTRGCDFACPFTCFSAVSWPRCWTSSCFCLCAPAINIIARTLGPPSPNAPLTINYRQTYSNKNY